MSDVTPQDDWSSTHVEVGQRWTSNSGGPVITVLQKSNHGHDQWLIKSEADAVMTTIDEWQLLDDYDLTPATTPRDDTQSRAQ